MFEGLLISDLMPDSLVVLGDQELLDRQPDRDLLKSLHVLEHLH